MRPARMLTQALIFRKKTHKTALDHTFGGIIRRPVLDEKLNTEAFKFLAY
jgi:hypothetical protein